jgi:hypothetical protein
MSGSGAGGGVNEVTDCVETIRIDPSLGESQRRQLIALVAAMRGESPT